MKMRLILLVIILIISIFSVYSFAYYMDYKTIDNKITVGISKIEIIEESAPISTDIIKADTEFDKSVKVRNLGDKAYVRCMIEYSDSRYEEACEVEYNSKDWHKEGRYWYYKKSIGKNEVTSSLMSKINFTKDMYPDFEIIVYAESVQKEGYSNSIDAFSSIN